MRQLLGLAIVIFVAALGVMVGYKLEASALAVVVGVVAGVLAGLPMAVLIVVMMRRAIQPQSDMASGTVSQQPPVIIVAGGQPQLMESSRRERGDWPAAPSRSPRDIRVVGDLGGSDLMTLWPDIGQQIEDGE